MKYTPTIITLCTVLLLLTVTSCTHSPSGLAASAARDHPNSSLRSDADSAAPPAGAQYTIYCTTIPGPAHVPQSTRLRDQLARSTGMRDWYVVHNADDSTLYYGYYRAVERQDDPKETARAKNDREKVRAIVDATGTYPFAKAVVVALDAPNPDAPAQWDLRRAPPGTLWSLQIAAYTGHPDRKKYAVDAVKAFRQEGVPAYYYHGETVSSVCIGAWPAEAVRGDLEPAYNDPNQNRSMEQIMAQSPADLLVVSPGLPPVNKAIRTKSGTLRAVSPHLEAVDPTLLAAMKNYPHHYLNGEVEAMKTAQGITGKPSLLVKIPRDPGSILGGGYDAAVAGDSTHGSRAADAGAISGLPPGIRSGATPPPPASSGRTPPTPPPAPGYGRLRSLEDR